MKAERFEIVQLESSAVPEVLGVLSSALGEGFDDAWFKWKHKRSPWGESPGWVARDGHGIVGVRLFLPWLFSFRDETLRALRPCDTVTLERARGHGVFRSLTETAIEQIGDGVDLYFNTPNSNSRPGYLKMGFREWTEVVQHVGAVLPGRAKLDSFSVPDTPGTGLTTLASEAFVRWRYLQCPRFVYRAHGLASSETANGIVWRVRESGFLRLMMVAELWGTAPERRALLRAAARESGARLAWIAGISQIRPSSRRGRTVVTRFDVTTSDLPPPGLSLGDIEDVL